MLRTINCVQSDIQSRRQIYVILLVWHLKGEGGTNELILTETKSQKSRNKLTVTQDEGGM